MREVRRFAEFEEMSVEGASLIAAAAVNSVADRGRFALALAGGRTPERIYELLSGASLGGRVPWEGVHLFWGDERCVPFDDPGSNFAMAQRTLISRIPIPSANVHPMPVESAAPSAAAEAYEEVLRDFFRFPRKHDAWEDPACGAFPAFDLVVLGVGADGHTASLFPGDTALAERTRWATAVPPQGSPRVWRVTLTLPVINCARRVLMVAAGHGKKRIFSELKDNPRAASLYPAAMVDPQGSHHLFFSEEA